MFPCIRISYLDNVRLLVLNIILILAREINIVYFYVVVVFDLAVELSTDMLWSFLNLITLLFHT